MVPAETFTAKFPLGHEDWLTAARIADRCVEFSPDVEEEQIADESLSCYNCRYRRWSTASITCCRQEGPHLLAPLAAADIDMPAACGC
jgi:hypothetical protein